MDISGMSGRCRRSVVCCIAGKNSREYTKVQNVFFRKITILFRILVNHAVNWAVWDDFQPLLTTICCTILLRMVGNSYEWTGEVTHLFSIALS